MIFGRGFGTGAGGGGSSTEASSFRGIVAEFALLSGVGVDLRFAGVLVFDVGPDKLFDGRLEFVSWLGAIVFVEERFESVFVEFTLLRTIEFVFVLATAGCW